MNDTQIKNATFNDFLSDVGFFDKNGLSVEYVSRGVISTRNIIAKFIVRTKEFSRVDYSSEEQSAYFQNEIDRRVKGGSIKESNTKAINNLVAELYYEVIV